MEKYWYYYIDGYHGGIRGHMPPGSFRDILHCLEKHPKWKISLDIEPISWDFLSARDPLSYCEIKKLIENVSDDARVEIVSGSYGQPFGWVIDGESNIRHLVRGREVLRQHFPHVPITTYATQEPCWTSALPQILRQLGYEGACLKNPSTAWGGYAEGYPDGIVNWAGPDGTTIPTVPRYACENLVHVWETESMNPCDSFVEKCRDAGIKHPMGTHYQDLGNKAWVSCMNAQGETPENVVYTTFRAYFNRIAEKSTKTWKPGQEIFCGALGWGDQILVRVGRTVRHCESALLLQEKESAFATLTDGISREASLQDSWDDLMMMQHHDWWICITVPGMADTVYHQAFAIDRRLEKSNVMMGQSLAKTFDPAMKTVDGQTIVVFNPTATSGVQSCRVNVTLPAGTQDVAVYDGEKELPVQITPLRFYENEGICAASLLIYIPFAGLGAKILRIEPCDHVNQKSGSVRLVCDETMVVLQNDCILLTLDLTHGGVVTSYILLDTNTEIVPEGAYFNEYKGYFIEQGRFCSNTEFPATMDVVKNGYLECAVCIHGKIADASYDMTISLQEGSTAPQIDVTFHFSPNTHVGEPYHMFENYHAETGPAHHDPHRTYHDGRYRLNAYFPTVFEQTYIDKDCAFDVCRSALQDTHFKTWNEIKHNIILHWVDAVNQDETIGIAVFSDHTTAYIHGAGYPLGLALAWGYEAIDYWWGNRSLSGDHSLSYRFMAHEGNWRQAGLWQQQAKWAQPPTAYTALCPQTKGEKMLLRIAQTDIFVSALFEKKGNVYVRLFNVGQSEQADTYWNMSLVHALLPCALDGIAENGSSPLTLDADGYISLSVPPFGIRTYRLLS